MADYLQLKNGTDVRGTADEGEGDPVTLTDRAVSAIAGAFCVFLQRRGIPFPVIAIGHDPRLSAKRLEHACVQGILSRGGKVILTGLSSTPSMFMLLRTDDSADASVMITASHLPARKNGLKFFLPGGGLESGELTEVLQLASSLKEVPFSGSESGISYRSYLPEYAAGLVRLVRERTGEEFPLAGKKILVDAGNGAGGFYADLVLKPLGADTGGSQFLEPDGNFPGHIPNPENAEAMASVCEAVKRQGADFGIIFDTDVDRAGAVSSSGEEINRNRLIALISAILLREHGGGPIVTDSVTSNGLTSFIEAHGGVHRRFKRGYRNVINESIRLNKEGIDSPLAIETSGHAAFRENYFLDDGAYLVTRLLIALSEEAKKGKELTDLIRDLPMPKEAKEVRLGFAAGVDYKSLGKDVIERLTEAAGRLPYLSLAPENHEGVRLNFDREHGDGWVLVRMSLHEPIMPVNAESDAEGGVKILLTLLHDLLWDCDFLDTEKLLA